MKLLASSLAEREKGPASQKPRLCRFLFLSFFVVHQHMSGRTVLDIASAGVAALAGEWAIYE